MASRKKKGDKKPKSSKSRDSSPGSTKDKKSKKGKKGEDSVAGGDGNDFRTRENVKIKETLKKDLSSTKGVADKIKSVRRLLTNRKSIQYCRSITRNRKGR